VTLNSSELQKIQRNVQTRHKALRRLSSAERRETILQLRDAQSKTAHWSAIFLFFLGLGFLAGTIFLWYRQYRMSLMSSLGIVAGLVVAGIGFRIVHSNKVKSFTKILSDDFSDGDILAWIQEHETINRRFLDQWRRWRQYIFFLLFVLFLLLFIRPTREFAAMLWLAGGTASC